MVDIKFSGGGAAKQTLNIGSFRGVDYANAPYNVSINRSPDAINMEPMLNGAVGCRHGYEALLNADGRINGIYSLKELKGDHILVHHGSKLSEWKNHKMCRYVVPDEGLLVDYGFTANDVDYHFSHLPMAETDTVVFNPNTNIVTVNDNSVDYSEGVGGIKLDMAADNTNLIYSAVIDNIGSSLGVSYSYITIDNFDLETQDSYPYRYVNLSFNTGNIPENGVTLIYHADTKILDVIGFADGEKHLTTYTTASTKGYYFNKEFIADKFPIYNNVGIVVNSYMLTVGNECYYWQSSMMVPGTKIEFDTVSKKLIINGEFYPLVDAVESYAEIVMEEYDSALMMLSCSLPDLKSSCCQMDNKLYIFTGSMAYVYGEYDVFDELGNNIGSEYQLRKMEDEAYVPTVVIASNPVKTVVESKSDHITTSLVATDSGGGGGRAYEDINLLSDSRCQRFCVSTSSNDVLSNGEYTGAGTVYHKLPLASSPIKSVDKVEVLNEFGSWQEVVSSLYTVDNVSGVLTFKNPLKVTPVTGRDNYKITYSVDFSGSIDEKSIKTEIDYVHGTDWNFNPPIIDEYNDASDYDKFANGEKFSAYKERIYLGKDVAFPNGVNVTVTFGERRNGNVFLGGRFDYDADGNDEKIYDMTFTATTEPTEHKIWLPNAKKYAMHALHDDEFSVDASYYVYVRFFSQIVQIGNEYYLDISDVYAIARNSKSSGGSIVIYFERYGIVYVKAEYSVRKNAYKDRVNKATICTKFGYGGNLDRLFVAGWDAMHEYEFWSEINNPLYFPDLNYARLGDGDTKIMGWNRVSNNQLAIHKNSNGSDSTVYIQNAVMNSDYSVNFPVIEGASGIGVVSERCFAVLNGEPLALSADGVFATKLVTDIPTDIKYAAPRSYYINPKLKQFNLANAEAIVFDERYYLAVGGYVFVADGKQKYMIGGNQGYDYSYEWYVWDNLPVRVWFVYEKELYFGTDDGRICKFNGGYTDCGKPINCHWTTPTLSFGTTPYYKKIKNVIVSCVLPTTEFSEVNIDYIDMKGEKNVKTALIDNTSRKLGMVQSIATNYKVKKCTAMQVRVRADNAEDFVLQDISVLYTVSGKFKG